MFVMMDSTGQGTAPERNDFAFDSVFSIVWMFVGSLFAMNLFVGGTHAAPPTLDVPDACRA